MILQVHEHPFMLKSYLIVVLLFRLQIFLLEFFLIIVCMVIHTGYFVFVLNYPFLLSFNKYAFLIVLCFYNECFLFLLSFCAMFVYNCYFKILLLVFLITFPWPILVRFLFLERMCTKSMHQFWLQASMEV